MPDVEWIRKLCLSFPDVTEDMPVGRRPLLQGPRQIFTIVDLSDGPPRIT
jgi:hypothetical protein